MPTTVYGFDYGVSDGYIQLQPQQYAPILPLMKAAKPKYWRMEVPWANVVTSLKAGPYVAAPAKAFVTATATGSGTVAAPGTNGSAAIRGLALGSGRVTGAAPNAQGRDWSYVDVCINDIRLQVGCDIVMIVGQSRPSGATNADYQAICAEAAQRYGPGGPGIRTDGIYAPNAGWGVTVWEMWNEPNNSAAWGGNVDPVAYTNLLIAGNAGIKSVQPGNQSTVIFAGTQPTQFVGSYFGRGWLTTDQFTFTQQAYAAGAQGHFDAMATHLYPIGDYAISGSFVGGMQIPCQNTTGPTQVTALATGSGRVNTTNPHGRLQSVALASGTGQLNPFQSPAPPINLSNDNFRQIQGIYALMQAQGDGGKGMWITEMGVDTHNGTTPQQQTTYMQQMFSLLSTLPYIHVALIYNVMDTSNSTADDGVNGFGIIDYTGKTRPVYDWLLTISPVADSGALSAVALATGSGAITSPAVASITFAASGSGVVVKSGGIITATATGSGIAAAAGTTTDVLTAVATGSGVVAITGSGGSDGTSSAAPTVSGAAFGVGRVNLVSPAHNGDQLIRATAFGSGSVATATAAGGLTLLTAVALGQGAIVISGAEIGVVGEVTGGALGVAAVAVGGGSAVSGRAGSALTTATITGAGRVGAVAGGASTITLTGTDAGSSSVNVRGAGTAPIAAGRTAAGQVGRFGSGALTVVETGSGGPTQVYTDMGAHVETVTATGGGVVAATSGAAPIVTASATGAGTVTVATSGAALTVTAAATAGPIALTGSGSLTAAVSAATAQAMTTTYAWAGSTRGPFNTTFWGNNGQDFTVSSGVAGDQISLVSSTAPDGAIYTGAAHLTPMGTPLHSAQTQVYQGGTYLDPRAVGVAVAGSDALMTNCVIGALSSSDGGVGATTARIVSKVGTTYTGQASSTGIVANANDLVGMNVFFNGTNFVYDLTLNGVSTGLSWIDTANLITPGRWVSPVLVGVVGGGNYYFSQGAIGFRSQDLLPTHSSPGTPLTATAATAGAGVAGKVATGSTTVTSTPTGGGGVATSTGGALAVTSTQSGAGVASLSTTGTRAVTAAASGAGAVGKVGGGAPVITATAAGASPPVAYGSTGAGADINAQTGTPKSISWSHTAAVGDYVLAFADAANYSTTAISSISATYAGVAMTLLGSVPQNNQTIGLVAIFGIRVDGTTVPAGAQTIQVTANSAGADVTALAGNSVGYGNVVSVGTVTTAYGASGSPAVSATGVPGGVVAAIMAQPANGANTFSAFSGTQRWNHTSAGYYDTTAVIGDTTATGALTLSATISSGTWWGAVAVVLKPN